MRTLLLLGALAVLAGCGRAGDIRPPGPPDQVTFPRIYPNPGPGPGR